MNKKIHQINAVLQYFFHKFWHSDFFDHEQHTSKEMFHIRWLFESYKIFTRHSEYFELTDQHFIHGFITKGIANICIT